MGDGTGFETETVTHPVSLLVGTPPLKYSGGARHRLSTDWSGSNQVQGPLWGHEGVLHAGGPASRDTGVLPQCPDPGGGTGHFTHRTREDPGPV